MTKSFRLLILFILPSTLSAHIFSWGENVYYKLSANGAFSKGENAPFWFTSNRYGLGTNHNSNGYLRAGLFRDIPSDNQGKWKAGYGAELAVPFGMDKSFVIQQLYADIQWKMLRLELGQKERPLELKIDELSSGAMTNGINARPLPQVRVGTADFWVIPKTKERLAIKTYIAYGWFTDNAWQREFNNGTINKYTANSKYHSKALFLRYGNIPHIPLQVTAGMEISSQFGGEAWNLTNRADSNNPDFQTHQNLGNGFKAYWQALTLSGSDSNDGDFNNALGNHLGSYHLRFDYKPNQWGISTYFEHFFEDHSQLFFQYGWKDMVYGIELSFPRNPVLSHLVYEHIGTMDQSGPIYHDATPNFPEQISGCDEYYNNHIYGAWQHSGFTIGNPLMISPLYSSSGNITIKYNRVNAHHIGLNGHPFSQLSWRLLYTHERSLGTYKHPTNNPKSANFLLCEVNYMPQQIQGLNITASYGHNDGDILGKSNGGMLTISYQSRIKRSKK